MAKKNNISFAEYIIAIAVVAAVAIIVGKLNWSPLIIAIAFFAALGYIFWRHRK